MGVRLELVEDEGYELARRLRNVIGQLRRGCAGHKPLVVVVANSSVADEVREGQEVAEDGVALTGNTRIYNDDY